MLVDGTGRAPKVWLDRADDLKSKMSQAHTGLKVSTFLIVNICSVEEAVARANKRAETDGREVDIPFIREVSGDIDKMLEVYLGECPAFDAIYVYDNNGSEPQFIYCHNARLGYCLKSVLTNSAKPWWSTTHTNLWKAFGKVPEDRQLSSADLANRAPELLCNSDEEIMNQYVDRCFNQITTALV